MWEPGLSGRRIAAIAVVQATPLLLIHRYRSMGIYTTFEGSQFLHNSPPATKPVV